MCLFKFITGLPCPGCGMTRAYLHLFTGDIKGAFYYHPLFWLVPIVLVIVIWRKNPYCQKWRQANSLWFGVLGLVLGVYLVRLGLYFPQQAPLDFDAQAVLPRLIASIFK